MTQTVSAAAAAPAPAIPQSVAAVPASLNFIRRQDEKPVFHSSALTGGAAKLFFEIEDHGVSIADMRPVAGELSIDHEGFALRRHATAVADLYDDDQIKQVYYPEIEALLGREFGASRVVVFDATRRSDSKDGAPNPDGLRGPRAPRSRGSRPA